MDSSHDADDDDEVQVASPPRMDMDESRALIQTVDEEDQMNNSFDVANFDPVKAKEVAAALEMQVNEMIYRAEDGIWTCKVCSKTITGRQAKGNMKQHVETHIEGIQHTCTTCGKTYKNRHSLHTHISMKHRYGLDCKHPVQSIITPIPVPIGLDRSPTDLDC
jgi:ribosomal protein L37AE/L43A